MKKRTLLVFLVGFAIAGWWRLGGSAQESNVLTAKKVDKGPVLDGKVDALWDDMSKQYAFGVAIFDNAQVRHAFAAGDNKLAFGK